MEPRASPAGDASAKRSRALLDAWERGLGETPGERALTLLESASPETHALHELPVGARDRRLLELRRRLFGAAVFAIASCEHCGAAIETRVRRRRRPALGERGLRLGLRRRRDRTWRADRPTPDGRGRVVAPRRPGRGAANPPRGDRGTWAQGQSHRRSTASGTPSRKPTRRQHLLRRHLSGVRKISEPALRHRRVRMERSRSVGGQATERRPPTRRRLRLAGSGHARPLAPSASLLPGGAERVTGFLTRLVEQASGASPAVRPRPVSRFEPDARLGGGVEVVELHEEVTRPRPCMAGRRSSER